jgi:hypothetical protein
MLVQARESDEEMPILESALVRSLLSRQRSKSKSYVPSHAVSSTIIDIYRHATKEGLSFVQTLKLDAIFSSPANFVFIALVYKEAQ